MDGWRLIYIITLYLGASAAALVTPVIEIPKQLGSPRGVTGKIPTDSKILKHLDNRLLKATENITNNPQIAQTLYKVSESLVNAVLTKLEAQDEITKLTNDALATANTREGMTAIETRRMLDYISKTMTNHLLSVTKQKSKPELQRLVYGLAQTAAELSIIATLNDVSYTSALSKKYSVDLANRKRRSPAEDHDIHNKIDQYNVPTEIKEKSNATEDAVDSSNVKSQSRFGLIANKISGSYHVVNGKASDPVSTKGFLSDSAFGSKPVLDGKGPLVLKTKINNAGFIKKEKLPVHSDLSSAATDFAINDEWTDTKTNTKTVLTIEDMLKKELKVKDDIPKSGKHSKQRIEKLESRAKKAILFTGEAAYIASSSIIALRRALTASLEVQASLNFAKNGVRSHRDLMLQLARTAAQQAGREARNVNSKALDCDRVMRLAVKYAAESKGAPMSVVANRVIIEGLSYVTVAKIVDYIASDVAMGSLYLATETKP